MRIVVLGATGNLGTSVVERLVADHAVDEVLGIARRRPEWRLAKVEWVEVDLIWSSACRHRPSTIVEAPPSPAGLRA